MTPSRATEPPPDHVVCFDLGGVVVRICNSWEEGCAAAGLDQRPPHSLDRAPPSIDARTRLVHGITVGAITCEEFFENLSAGVGGLYAPHEFERVHRAWILGEYPGVSDLITRLSAKPNIPTACLSNTNHVHWEQLHEGIDAPSGARRAARTPRFPAFARLARRFASHEMRLAKPDESIYRAFERAVGAAADRIIFFDDKPENIAAAQTLRWRAILIDPTTDTAPQIERALTRFGVL
jgi:FMN phosphatase YigB (HAD superfamily)